MKQCPYCAEEIQDAAIKCKHCGEFLDEHPPSRSEAPTKKWYFRKIYLILILGCIGPLGLPLIWMHPTLTRAWKIGLTVLVLLLTWFSIFATIEAVKMMGESYNELMQTMDGF